MKFLFTFLSLCFSTLVFSQEKFDIFFDFNKDIPNEKSALELQKWITENDHAQVLKIYGYCDSVDDNSYNKELALKRIQSTLKTLTENKIQISKSIELIPFGKDFKRSLIQEENRKVTLFYELLKLPVNNVGNEEIPTMGDITAKIERERATLASKFAKAKIGDIITIENIYFQLDTDKIIEKSRPILNELYEIMRKNPKLNIRINGHICCNVEATNSKLSSQRAIAVKAFLLEKQIHFYRLSYKGFGSTKPIFEIPEKNEKERLANRRVEIEIVAN
ncbi:OmpA family protein [Flavobacterium amnicola]|nr:OmpA family protein [Flavobacterium amnicola]